MSAEGIPGALVIGAANGAGMAMATTIPIDHGLALGAIGGCCAYLASSVAIPLSSRIFYSIFSFIIGYLSGVLLLNWLSYNGAAAVLACLVSALASYVFGSLKRWSDGGPRPDWIEWASTLLGGLIPSFLKRGKRDDG